MAEDKKSFLLYVDQRKTVDQLPDEIAGKLFKLIYSYCDDDCPEVEDLLLRVAFEPIKQSLKRDLKRYEARAERSKVNGAKGGRPKKNPEEPKETQKTQRVISEPRKPDSVSVSVSDSVSDNVITTKGENYSKAVIDCCISCIQFFDEHLKPTTKSQKNKWLDTIDKLNRIDGIPFNQIIDVVRKTRSDEFWSKNFLSITKLRKKNKDDVSYVVVFNEKFKSNEKSRLEKFVQSDGSNRFNEFFGK